MLAQRSEKEKALVKFPLSPQKNKVRYGGLFFFTHNYNMNICVMNCGETWNIYIVPKSCHRDCTFQKPKPFISRTPTNGRHS